MQFDLYTVSGLIMLGLEAVSFIVALIVAIRRKGYINRLEIEEMIPFFTRQANEFLGSKTGKAKLQFVLAQIQALCSDKSVDYDKTKYTSLVEYYLGADAPKEALSNETDESSSQERPSYLCSYRKQD